MITYNDTYSLLANRSQHMHLRLFHEAVSAPGNPYRTVDDLVQSTTVTVQPVGGKLIGSGLNWKYIPNKGFVGYDSCQFLVNCGETSETVYASLNVSSTPRLSPYIPEPPFGIKESHWQYKNSIGTTVGSVTYNDFGYGPATHFVDFSNGNDKLSNGTDNVFGTPSLPRKTIPTILTAGSVVECIGSTYNSGHSIAQTTTIKCTGLATRPIFIRGRSPELMATITHGVKIVGKYVILENIKWDCSRGNITPWAPGGWLNLTEDTNGTHHPQFVCLRHSKFENMPNGCSGGVFAILVGVNHNKESLNTSSILIKNIVIYDVEVSNFGQWTEYESLDDYGAITGMANTDSLWVLNCHFHHIHGQGISASRNNALANQVGCNKLFAANNIVHHTKEWPVCFKFATNSIIAENKIFTSRCSASSLGEGIAILNNDGTLANPYSDNVLMAANEIYDTERGISVYNTLYPQSHLTSYVDDKPCRMFLFNNIVHHVRNLTLDKHPSNCAGQAVIMADRVQSYMVHNLFDKCEDGPNIALISNNPSRNTTMFCNNIVMNIGPLANGKESYYLRITNQNTMPYITASSNVNFASSGTPIKIMNGDPSYVGGVINSVNGSDPGFCAPNYRWPTLKNNGSQSYLTQFIKTALASGFVIDRDVDNIFRIQGSIPDAGPSENESEYVSPLPYQPSVKSLSYTTTVVPNLLNCSMAMIYVNPAYPPNLWVKTEYRIEEISGKRNVIKLTGRGTAPTGNPTGIEIYRNRLSIFVRPGYKYLIRARFIDLLGTVMTPWCGELEVS